MGLLKMLENYQPDDEIEGQECEALKQFVLAFGDKAYERENLVGHITVSAWVVNARKDKVLMVFHNLYRSWTWPGGHADGETNLLEVAIKEVREETGAKIVKAVLPVPIDINVLPVGNHIKQGKFVPRHLHYNLVYLLEADENNILTKNPEENSGVGWFEVSKINNLGLEDHILPYYYRIIKKVKERKL